MQLKAEQRILFIGDSITDSFRDYTNDYDLGIGYAHIAGSLILGQYPDLNLKVFNRGINGDKLADLANRWQADCLDLKPDTVSILIGVNDIAHNRMANEATDAVYLSEFDQTYRRLLSTLREANPQVQLILLQPFIMPTSIDTTKWRRELKQMNQLIEAIARDFDADFIRVDEYLMHLTKEIPPQKLTGNDGIHPTRVGHGVIANLWLKNIETIQA